jgi:hypothetical protein
VTGSTHPAIDDVVTMWNRGAKDQAVEMVRGDPDLRGRMEAELLRLKTPGPARDLLHADRPDAVSLRHFQWLTAILEKANA